MSNEKPRQVSNNIVLKAIQNNHSNMALKIPMLRQAYIKYHTQHGRPVALNPIGLTDPEADVLYGVYKGETKKYSVLWIGECRTAREQTYCPLCGGPNPSQLEHYLPRAHYPEFTVLSWNLVPTCAVCNPKRGHHAHAPREAVQLLHPYYDRGLLTQPLFAANIIRPFSAVSFVPVTSPGPFSPEIIERLERQIRLCFNGENFNRWLANKLWKELHAELSGLPTQAEATKIVARRYKIHRVTTGINSWDTIFFRSLLMDDDAVRWLRDAPSPII